MQVADVFCIKFLTEANLSNEMQAREEYDKKFSRLETNLTQIMEGDTRVFRYLTIMAASVSALFAGMFTFAAVLLGVSYLWGSATITILKEQVETAVKRIDNRILPNEAFVTTDFSNQFEKIMVGEMYLSDDGGSVGDKHFFKINVKYGVKLYTAGHGSVVAVGLFYKHRGNVALDLFKTGEGLDKIDMKSMENGYIIEYSGIKTLTNSSTLAEFYENSGSLTCSDALKRMEEMSLEVDKGEIDVTPVLQDDSVKASKVTFQLQVQRQTGSWLCNDRGLLPRN